MDHSVSPEGQFPEVSPSYTWDVPRRQELQSPIQDYSGRQALLCKLWFMNKGYRRFKSATFKYTAADELHTSIS